jgi:hypothetical protein
LDSENQKDERYADNEYYEKYDNYDEKNSHYFIAPKICYVESPVIRYIAPVSHLGILVPLQQRAENGIFFYLSG